MLINKYLYSFIYDNTEKDLCKLESKYLFDIEEQNKLLFSNIKIEPSYSAYIKSRLDIISIANDFSNLIVEIKKEGLSMEGAKIEYLALDDDSTGYTEGLEKMREIGCIIDGIPDYYSPKLIYALCFIEGVWYFGILNKNGYAWKDHKEKPHSYSNSISINIAKSLVNFATKGNKEITLLDGCCGVGTIMLEACYAGITIDGCDNNWKICKNARENLAYFNYSANIFHSDIKEISNTYDAVIIDLPYNLASRATEKEITHIVESTAKNANRLIIVTIADITDLIHNIGFEILDYCTVSKRGKRQFARRIWVCEKIG